MAPEQAQRWRQAYCGLCAGLGEEHGLVSRATISHEAVLLTTVVDGLLEQGAEERSGACPLSPLRRRAVLSPDSVAVRCAAHVQALMAEQWLADQVQDGRGLAELARPLARSWSCDAHASLAELGMDLAPLRDLAQRQKRIEIIGRTSPEQAARPTMELLGTLSAQLGQLPGAPAALSDPATTDRLRALGRDMGLAIYLLDAFDDLERDQLRGDFNPCLRVAADGTPQACASRLAACEALLDGAVQRLGRLAEQLPWQRHQALIMQVLQEDLPRIARRAELRAQRCASPEGQLALARQCARSLLARTWYVFWAAWLSTWSWLRRSWRPPRLLAAGEEDDEDEAGSKKKSEGCLSSVHCCGVCDCSDLDCCCPCGDGCDGCDCGGCDCG